MTDSTLMHLPIGAQVEIIGEYEEDWRGEKPYICRVEASGDSFSYAVSNTWPVIWPGWNANASTVTDGIRPEDVRAITPNIPPAPTGGGVERAINEAVNARRRPDADPYTTGFNNGLEAARVVAVQAARATTPAQQPLMIEEVREALEQLRHYGFKHIADLLESLSSQSAQIPPARTFEDGFRDALRSAAAYATAEQARCAEISKRAEREGRTGDASSAHECAAFGGQLAREFLSLLPPDQEGTKG